MRSEPTFRRKDLSNYKSDYKIVVIQKKQPPCSLALLRF